MNTKIVLPRSQQSRILWHFHVVLDHVAEGERGRRQFVSRVLKEFGVPWWNRLSAVRRVCALLPRDQDDVHMQTVMEAFERVILIEWQEDLQMVEREITVVLERQILGFLAQQSPFPLPKDVAANIIAELVSLMNERFTRDQLLSAEHELKELLIGRLWRCNDADSQRGLAEDILSSLGGTLKLSWTH